MTDKTMRALLVDPERRAVEEVQVSAGKGLLADLHRLTGADGLDQFKIADHGGGNFDQGWVDDTGLSQQKPVHAFRFSIGKDPLAGRCIIIGMVPGGDAGPAQMTLEFARSEIVWLGLIKPKVTWEHSATGSRAVVSYEEIA